jgi:hypothetical protein
MVVKILKCVSLPLLSIGAMLSRFAASYELLLNVLICLAAVVVVRRAVSTKEYYWAAAFVAVAVVFSPLALVVKIFLLMGFTCFVAVAAVIGAWRPQPVAAL